MIADQKPLFDLPDGYTYLDCAARSPLMRAVADAGTEGVRRKVHPWTYTLGGVDAEAERARQRFAELIGADADCIAIQPAASYGIATAAANLPIETGQSVVVLEGQFPSNVYAWRHLAETRGGTVVTVARPRDGRWTPAVLDAIDTETAIAALPFCHWTDGSLLDMAAIADKCRGVGAALVIDATQSAGAMAIDVKAIKPDFLIAAAYKWLMCPYTLSFLYASPERRRGTPVERHSWNHADALRLLGAEEYADDLADDARRFDMGERNNPINIPMAVAALEQVALWGPAEIARTLRPITSAVADKAAARGWQVPAERVDHYVGFRVAAGLPDGLWRKLCDDNVFVSVRGDAVRVSPYLYNDVEDVDRLFEVLDRLIG